MLTVNELITKAGFDTANKTPPQDREIKSVYCCDLLSVVMGKAPADSAWVTVMGNVNVVAVCSLADTACVVVADGAEVDENAVAKADEHGVFILRSGLPVFEAAKLADSLLQKAGGGAGGG